MPASFAKDLCGYRKHGKPNTSDATDNFSVELGHALFDAIGVENHAAGEDPTGTPLSVRVAEDLQAAVLRAESSLVVIPERPLNDFEQFRHVGALKGLRPEPSRDFQRAWNRLTKFTRARIAANPRAVERLEGLIADVDRSLTNETEARRILIEEVGDESLLKLDVTAALNRGTGLPSIEIGLSLKWSLRTDRAQDCRSQGARMSALRRGRMPHFAAVTMEPRPYMLNLLGGGSGEVDCVYHLHLPALTAAVEQCCDGRPRRRNALETFHRLVAQRRLRDYEELVGFALTL